MVVVLLGLIGRFSPSFGFVPARIFANRLA
jgi:hypothetical protein